MEIGKVNQQPGQLRLIDVRGDQLIAVFYSLGRHAKSRCGVIGDAAVNSNA